MRVLTSIFLTFPEQDNDQELTSSVVKDALHAKEYQFELVSIFEGKNRVMVIEQSED
jgi:hypothetical protein